MGNDKIIFRPNLGCANEVKYAVHQDTSFRFHLWNVFCIITRCIKLPKNCIHCEIIEKIVRCERSFRNWKPWNDRAYLLTASYKMLSYKYKGTREIHRPCGVDRNFLENSTMTPININTDADARFWKVSHTITF